jgi:hypothetical protein
MYSHHDDDRDDDPWNVRVAGVNSWIVGLSWSLGDIRGLGLRRPVPLCCELKRDRQRWNVLKRPGQCGALGAIRSIAGRLSYF